MSWKTKLLWAVLLGSTAFASLSTAQRGVFRDHDEVRSAPLSLSPATEQTAAGVVPLHVEGDRQ